MSEKTYTRADLANIELRTRGPEYLWALRQCADVLYRAAVCGECGEPMGGNEACPYGCQHPANLSVVWR